MILMVAVKLAVDQSALVNRVNDLLVLRLRLDSSAFRRTQAFGNAVVQGLQAPLLAGLVQWNDSLVCGHNSFVAPLAPWTLLHDLQAAIECFPQRLALSCADQRVFGLRAALLGSLVWGFSGHPSAFRVCTNNGSALSLRGNRGPGGWEVMHKLGLY